MLEPEDSAVSVQSLSSRHPLTSTTGAIVYDADGVWHCARRRDYVAGLRMSPSQVVPIRNQYRTSWRLCDEPSARRQRVAVGLHFDEQRLKRLLCNEEGLIRTATTHGRGRLPVRADKPC